MQAMHEAVKRHMEALAQIEQCSEPYMVYALQQEHEGKTPMTPGAWLAAVVADVASTAEKPATGSGDGGGLPRTPGSGGAAQTGAAQAPTQTPASAAAGTAASSQGQSGQPPAARRGRNEEKKEAARAAKDPEKQSRSRSREGKKDEKAEPMDEDTK